MSLPQETRFVNQDRCGCGVPLQVHGTGCGWNNANVIIFDGENYITAHIYAEEKEIRWIISQSQNAKALSDWWVGRRFISDAKLVSERDELKNEVGELKRLLTLHKNIRC